MLGSRTATTGVAEMDGKTLERVRLRPLLSQGYGRLSRVVCRRPAIPLAAQLPPLANPQKVSGSSKPKRRAERLGWVDRRQKPVLGLTNAGCSSTQYGMLGLEHRA